MNVVPNLPGTAVSLPKIGHMRTKERLDAKPDWNSLDVLFLLFLFQEKCIYLFVVILHV